MFDYNEKFIQYFVALFILIIRIKALNVSNDQF